jgi:hypothetical protein
LSVVVRRAEPSPAPVHLASRLIIGLSAADAVGGSVAVTLGGEDAHRGRVEAECFDPDVLVRPC